MTEEEFRAMLDTIRRRAARREARAARRNGQAWLWIIWGTLSAGILAALALWWLHG